MRAFLTAAVIVIAALGLIWVVRLQHAASEAPASPPKPDSAQAAVDHAIGIALASAAPAVTLGAIGGKLPGVLVDPKLLVEKSRRTLAVFSAGQVVKTYRIALGARPLGDKVRQGDRRTPEGDFYVCVRNDESKYVRSLGLSYPDKEDAERGVAAGLITKREQRAIVEAIRHYRRPPYNTKLGGEIMIHGGGTGTDWSTGCIALSNSDIAELYPRIGLGTPVEIRP
ncbi:MAG: L,D-transpeptidase [Coriobacteriia bacterium]|nr:L,D-transpeptidase [Coriobacteriia bacterium]